MPSRSTTEKNNADSAISPVVGVMLMLMLTVITAGVVAGVAVSTVDETFMAKPPSMDITSSFTDDGKIVVYIGKSDATVSPDDIEMILTYTDGEGIATQNLNDDTWLLSGTRIVTDVNLTSVTKSNVITYVTNNSRYEAEKNNNSNGGYKMSITIEDTYGLGDEADDAMDSMKFNLNLKQGNSIKKLESGESVELTINHIPSGKTIYKKQLTYVDLN